ncbi:MAG TPA: hypothetical protein VND99_02805 [Candidatus Acidoferrales bacterium]|nr:hypothetical protein [Candidatus Acidoferrales bacterium]
MPIKRKKKTTSKKKFQRGSVGSFFVFGVLALLIVLGLIAVGGTPPQTFPQSGQQVIVVTPTPDANHNTLQLKTFGYITIAPTPIPSKNSLCVDKGVNNEPEILTAYSPAPGQPVSNNGQIKVWVTDEGAPFIAPGETTNADGSINNPGQQQATAPDGYLFEPALYIAPQTAESGGHPNFPNFIKGQYDNAGQAVGNNFTNLQGHVTTGAKIDPLPAGTKQGGCLGNFQVYCYTAEYIWDVSKLGLSTGTYQAEFLIHDGDRDRGVGCVTIKIQ